MFIFILDFPRIFSDKAQVAKSPKRYQAGVGVGRPNGPMKDDYLISTVVLARLPWTFIISVFDSKMQGYSLIMFPQRSCVYLKTILLR
jgi:hypothetical protein